MGKPVVSTTVGAEGLPVTPGTDVVIADTADTFAEAVVRLFRGDAERRRVGAAAKRLVAERYDWSAVFGHLEEALEAAAGRSRPRNAPAPVGARTSDKELACASLYSASVTWAAFRRRPLPQTATT